MHLRISKEQAKKLKVLADKNKRSRPKELSVALDHYFRFYIPKP